MGGKAAVDRLRDLRTDRLTVLDRLDDADLDATAPHARAPTT